MNFLFLDSIETGIFGGYENWIRLAAGHFVARGHNVTIAGRPGSEYLRRLSQVSDKITLLELDISGDFNPFTIHKLRKHLETNAIDLMTVNFNKDIRIGGLAARWYGKTKVVWRIGLDITRDSIAHRELTPRLVDAVFVPSEGLKRQVTRFGYLTDDMVQVIHTGLEQKEFARPDPDARNKLLDKYGLPQNAIIAVSSGRFVDQKGHVYLCDAAAEALIRNPELVFLWLGDGHREAMLREKVKTLGIEKSVVFAGMLDNTDLELAGSDMMIHSAIEEPFSHSVLEGMRAGLPLVATRVGGTPESVVDGSTGILVEPRDPSAMAMAITRLAENTSERLSMGQAGQERWRQKFTIDIMMSKVETLFNALMNGRD